MFYEHGTVVKHVADGAHVVNYILAASFIADHEVTGFREGDEGVAFACRKASASVDGMKGAILDVRLTTGVYLPVRSRIHLRRH